MLWVQIIEHFELPFWPLAIGDCKGDPRESLQVRLARDEKYLEALLLDGHTCSNYGYAIWFSWDCCKPSSYGISAHFPEIPALNLLRKFSSWTLCCAYRSASSSAMLPSNFIAAQTGARRQHLRRKGHDYSSFNLVVPF